MNHKRDWSRSACRLANDFLAWHPGCHRHRRDRQPKSASTTLSRYASPAPIISALQSVSGNATHSCSRGSPNALSCCAEYSAEPQSTTLACHWLAAAGFLRYSGTKVRVRATSGKVQILEAPELMSIKSADIDHLTALSIKQTDRHYGNHV